MGVTNTYFGGPKLNVKNLIMTNGIEVYHINFIIINKDPWQHASVTSTKSNSDVLTIVIDCENCAHCSDTKAPKDTDAQALKDARTTITNLIGEWKNGG